MHVSRYNQVSQDDSKAFAEYSKAIEASQDEVSINKRSRSAKLRFAVKN